MKRVLSTSALRFALLYSFILLVSIACSSSSNKTSFDLAYLDGDGRIWLADSASGKTKRLGDSPQCRGANNLSWAPGVEHIACLWPDNGETRLIDREGRLVKSMEEAYNFSWAPAGGYSWHAGGDGRLHVLDADGREVVALDARIDYETRRWTTALWLRDGNGLLFSDPSGHIFVYDLNREEQRDPIVWGSYDSWAIAGDRLVIIEVGTGGKELVAKIYEVEGRDARLSHRQTLPIGYGSPVLSADGSKLAVLVGGELDVFDLESSATEPTARFRLCECATPPGVLFSADGDYVYWDGPSEASSSGRALYRARVDGSDRYKVLELASQFASVSGDLRKVAYLEGEATALKELWVLEIETGKQRRVAKEAVVFSWAVEK